MKKYHKQAASRKRPNKVSAGTIAQLITGSVTFSDARGLPVLITVKSANGKAVSEILNVLTGNDRPDARPPGICQTCFEMWGRRPARPRMIVCKHNRAAARLNNGIWMLASGLSTKQVAELRGRE